MFAVFIAWFALVFTGRYPEGLYNFNAGYLRMATRVNSFMYLITDEFPSFGGGDDPDYPVRVGIAPPLDKYSRAKAFFRLIVGIPVMILAYVMSLILSMLSLIAWFTIVFAAKFPDSALRPGPRGERVHHARERLLPADDRGLAAVLARRLGGRSRGRDQQRGGQPPGLTSRGSDLSNTFQRPGGFTSALRKRSVYELYGFH